MEAVEVFVVDFVMVEFSCAQGVIVNLPGTLVLTY